MVYSERIDALFTNLFSSPERLRAVATELRAIKDTTRQSLRDGLNRALGEWSQVQRDIETLARNEHVDSLERHAMPLALSVVRGDCAEDQAAAEFERHCEYLASVAERYADLKAGTFRSAD